QPTVDVSLRETKHLPERADYTAVRSAVRTTIGASIINWRKLRGSKVRTPDPTVRALHWPEASGTRAADIAHGRDERTLPVVNSAALTFIFMQGNRPTHDHWR